MFDNQKLQRNGPIIKFLIVLTVLIILVPIIWLIFFSFKTQNEIMIEPFKLPENWNFENYKNAINVVPWFSMLKNSFILLVLTIPIEIVLVTVVSFAISRITAASPKLRKFTHTYFTAGLIIPTQVMIFPVYRLLMDVSLWDTHLGVALTLIGWSAPFATNLLVGAFNKVPASLEEAAILDGCNIWQLLYHVMTPMVKNSIYTILIMNTLATWNDYFLSKVILNNNELWPTALVPMFFKNRYGTDYGLTAAGIVIILLPQIIFYLFMQKHIISGVSAGSVKE